MPTSPARAATTSSSPTASPSASTSTTCADRRSGNACGGSGPIRSTSTPRQAARVTHGVAERLAAVSKALEDQEHDAETVALFLMRCLFTMFACSPGIELLPEASFRDILARCEQDPSIFVPKVGQLWEAMDKGGFAHALEKKVRHFNGEFFRTRTVLKLGRAEIGELRHATAADWKEVDPSIFGTLLEQALDKTERKRLGAHYT